VTDLIELVAAVDSLLQAQAQADSEYFHGIAAAGLTARQRQSVQAAFLAAYRWQFVFSGVGDERFKAILRDLLTPTQSARIGQALGAIGTSVPAAA